MTDQPRPSPVVTFEDVTLSFGGVLALDEVTFSLQSNEVVGLIGPNGAGKTSLINCLTGYYSPTRGHMRVGGTTIDGYPTPRIAGLGVARTFQQAESLSGVGARDVMLLGRERFMQGGMLSYALGLPSARRAEADALRRITEIAEELQISAVVDANSPFEKLPYGTRKLVDLGRALAGDPTVLLMDEPAAGLSAAEKDRMINVIRDVQGRRKLTQLLVDHDIDFVSELCTRLVVLDAGRVIANGPVAETLALPAVVESYIGTAPEDMGQGAGR